MFQKERAVMARRKKIYEGKAKILYEGPEPGTIVQYFKDDATAFNAAEEGRDRRQGRAEQPPVRILHDRAEQHRRADAFHQAPQHARAARALLRDHSARSDRAQLCRRHRCPSASGSRRAPPLPRPIVEYCYKDDKLGDPLVTEEHIAAFGWASQQDMDDILSLALRVNDFMSGVMMAVGIRLVDFKIEIGRRL